MPEFELIERIRARARARADVVLGIGDDGAVLAPPPDRQLVAVIDTLVSGVHFPAATQAADIGWKALAVNLSDLAAMGAEPAWALLALTLPADDPAWLDAFLDGFDALAARYGLALVGGDTTRGPLSVSVHLTGFVPPGMAMTRSGAHVGDTVWASGTLGDAAAALALLSQGDAVSDALLARLNRPQPRVAEGLVLRGHAHAAIDVSDGLLADLGHVCAASGVGAEIDAEALPASSLLPNPALESRRAWQLTGGDDYELVFTLPAGVDAAELLKDMAGATAIGRIVAGTGVRVRDAEGRTLRIERSGYRHFEAPP